MPVRTRGSAIGFSSHDFGERVSPPGPGETRPPCAPAVSVTRKGKTSHAARQAGVGRMGRERSILPDHFRLLPRGLQSMAPKDDHSDKPERFNVSRRSFLKTAGISSLAAGVAGVAEIDAQTTGPRAVGPGEVPVSL